MPALEVLNHSYFEIGDLYRVLSYVERGGSLYGLAVDPNYALNQMLLVKQIWHKTEGRQCRHWIVSFGDEEFLTYDEAVYYGYQIADYYAKRFQIVFAVHTNTNHLHLHFVQNSVSYVDGKYYSGGQEDYIRLRNHIQKLMPHWRV